MNSVLQEGGRFRVRNILPVVAIPLALSFAASGCSHKNAEAFRIQGRVTIAVPEAPTPLHDIPRSMIVFPSANSTEESALRPLEMPTATQIRKFLPPSMHPWFLFENDQQKDKDKPSFVTIGPVILNRVILNSGPVNVDSFDGKPPVGQKYLEFQSAEKAGKDSSPFILRVSFLNYMPGDSGPLLNLANNNPPGTRYQIRFPLSPGSVQTNAMEVSSQQTRGLTPAEAGEYIRQVLEGNGQALTGRDADLYPVAFSIDSVNIYPKAGA